MLVTLLLTAIGALGKDLTSVRRHEVISDEKVTEAVGKVLG